MGLDFSLHVVWQIFPLSSPLVWRHCRRCEILRPFRSSDCFRINAQKKTLDVWLVYRCDRCSQSWNYPLFERIAVSALAPELHAKFIANCRATAWHYACDLERLRSRADHLELSKDLRVEKRFCGPWANDPGQVILELHTLGPVEIRLDRFLAQELVVSRSAIRQLVDRKTLVVSPNAKTALRRRIPDRQTLVFDLTQGHHPPAVKAALLNNLL